MINLISSIGNAMFVHLKIAHFVLTTFRRKPRMLNAYLVFTQPLSSSHSDTQILFSMSGKISYMLTKLSILMPAQSARSKRPIKQCGTLLQQMFLRTSFESDKKLNSRKFTLLVLAWVEDCQLSLLSTSITLRFLTKLKSSTMVHPELQTKSMLNSSIMLQKINLRDIL